ncbi:hypothetical protein PINS_up007692 [Pythium insidiosum]|nr:hypothetical protein PINS_up007692 [Pythium insidiosum]
MSTSSLKLTYFDFPVRAELTRLVLTAGAVEFIDERLADSEFAARKDGLPLGQVPVLEVDGVLYPQSLAIAKYAARVAGLYPSDAKDALLVDSILSTLLEVTDTYVILHYYTPDASEKASKSTTFLTKTMPRVLGFLESRVRGQFFLGDELSVADIHLFDTLINGLGMAFPSFPFHQFPKLSAIVERVATQPRIAAYLATHK